MDTGFLHKNIPNHYAICRLLELLPVLLFEIIHHRALKVFDPALNAPFQKKHLEVALPPEFGNILEVVLHPVRTARSSAARRAWTLNDYPHRIV